MAKFNTLAGGYYGKLGATVGQRWKNLRTVRTYVIPHNPQTEVQQANRRRFSDCVWFAQIAQQINPKTTAFDTSSKTLWNCRMSTARALQDLELTQMDRIPLYPTTLSVPNVISAANVTEVVDSTHIVVTVEGVELEEERVLMMLVLLPGAEEWKDRLALCVGTNGDEGGNEFTFRIPEGVTLSQGMYCRFCSCDDVSSATDLIASSQIELSYVEKDIHTFDTSVRSLVRANMNYVLTMNEPYFVGTHSVGTVVAHGVFNGTWRNWTISDATLINNGGYFALSFTSTASRTSMIPAFPEGSYFTINNISAISSTVEATAETATENASNDDLTRVYNNTINSVSRSGNVFSLTFEETIPTISSYSGSYTVHAVENGVFVNKTISALQVTDKVVSFTNTVAEEQNQLAFPSGATVTFPISIVGNGVSYNPSNATAQSVVNTSDLVREIETSLGWSTSDSAFTVSLASGATITSGGSSQSATTKNHNQLFQSSKTSTLTVSYSGNKIKVATPDITNDTILFSTDSFTLPSATNFTAEGVTYTLPSQTISHTQSGTQTLDSSLWDFGAGHEADRIGLTAEGTSVSFVANTAPSSVTLHTPSTMYFADRDGATADISIDSASATITQNSISFDMLIGVDLEGSGLDYENQLGVELNNNFYLTDGNGNTWLMPEIDIDSEYN